MPEIRIFPKKVPTKHFAKSGHTGDKPLLSFGSKYNIFWSFKSSNQKSSYTN